jgi:hypothetical protein
MSLISDIERLSSPIIARWYSSDSLCDSRASASPPSPIFVCCLAYHGAVSTLISFVVGLNNFSSPGLIERAIADMSSRARSRCVAFVDSRAAMRPDAFSPQIIVVNASVLDFVVGGGSGCCESGMSGILVTG